MAASERTGKYSQRSWKELVARSARPLCSNDGATLSATSYRIERIFDRLQKRPSGSARRIWSRPSHVQRFAGHMLVVPDDFPGTRIQCERRTRIERGIVHCHAADGGDSGFGLSDADTSLWKRQLVMPLMTTP